MLEQNVEFDAHAGNDGDPAKAALLISVLEALGTKNPDLIVVESHSGAGAYRVSSTCQGLRAGEKLLAHQKMARKQLGWWGDDPVYVGTAGLVLALSSARYIAFDRDVRSLQRLLYVAERCRAKSRVEVHWSNALDPAHGLQARVRELGASMKRGVVLCDPFSVEDLTKLFEQDDWLANVDNLLLWWPRTARIGVPTGLADWEKTADALSTMFPYRIVWQWAGTAKNVFAMRLLCKEPSTRDTSLARAFCIHSEIKVALRKTARNAAAYGSDGPQKDGK